MPWRVPEPGGRFDPYKILVSEIMLQQTQVPRVIPKFQTFLERFPDVYSLASAGLHEVLQAWVGLGYNRRAKFLHEATKQLADSPEPWTIEKLVSQKGIGPNTAAAVLAYAYDLPVLFIETNIRTVLIHHFYNDQNDITDKALTETLSGLVPWNNPKTSALSSPRLFYWAMMDYGTYVKASFGNVNNRSKSYARQSAFHGSLRQVRGRVIRILGNGPLELSELRTEVKDERLPDVLDKLAREQLVTIQDETVMLYNG